MRIAVEGCAHGELEIIYEALQEIEKYDGRKIDLLICCGDFQSTRNAADLSCMAVPDKYKDMCTFYKYYSGEKVAPVLTIFVGGNHEASNYLQELPYGGWVAPNIYYLGYAGVITVAGVRIAGMSGIYKSQDFMQGHWERAPYTNSSIRSVYHIRNLEVFRLKQLSGKIDIFLSHDWPRGITRYGDERSLLRNKPFFKNDIEANALGSPPSMELLEHHYPSYWFSAHLHCKFAALVTNDYDPTRSTKFLALDKCLPKRKFLQILEIPHDEKLPIKFFHDLEWLTILYLTNHLLSVKSGSHYMPGQGGNSRWNYVPTESEKNNVMKKFNDNLEIMENFSITTSPYSPETSCNPTEPPRLCLNPQTTCFVDKLGIDDPSALLLLMSNSKENSFDNSGTYNRTLDSRDESTTFDDNVVNSTLDDDSPEDLDFRVSPINITPEIFTIENDHLDDRDEQVERLEEDKDEQVERLEEDKDEQVERLEEDKEIDDKIIDEIDGKIGQIPIEPNCKKFKRRNHALYTDPL